MKISTINQRNSSLSSEIINKDIINTQLEQNINHRLVALSSSSIIYHNEFTEIIRNIKEYQLIMNWLGERSENIFLCYSSTRTGDKSDDPLRFCKYGKTLVIMIQTTNGNRFGVVLFNINYSSRTSEDSKAFLFNLDTQSLFLVRNPSIAYYFLIEENAIIIGNDDLMLTWNYESVDSYSKFPNAYGNDNNNVKDFTGEDVYFQIENLEFFGDF